MAILYIALGIIVGGLSALILMAMFFVSKEADDHDTSVSKHIKSVIRHKDIA